MRLKLIYIVTLNSIGLVTNLMSSCAPQNVSINYPIEYTIDEFDLSSDGWYYRDTNWNQFIDTIEFGQIDYFIGVNQLRDSWMSHFIITDSTVIKNNYVMGHSKINFKSQEKHTYNLLETFRISQPTRYFQVQNLNDMYNNDVTLLYYENGIMKLAAIFNVKNSSFKELPRFEQLTKLLENSVELKNLSSNQ